MKKLFLTLLFCLLASTCFAGQVKYCTLEGGCQDITYNDKYSSKDFTGRNLLDVKDLEGKIIFGSCFSQETPDTKVFPDVKNLTLINCNLDNVYLDKNWQVIGGTQRRFKVQNDLEDWIIDKDNKPTEPILKEQFQKLGISINPNDIPTIKMTESITEKKQKELSATP